MLLKASRDLPKTLHTLTRNGCMHPDIYTATAARGCPPPPSPMGCAAAAIEVDPKGFNLATVAARGGVISKVFLKANVRICQPSQQGIAQISLAQADSHPICASPAQPASQLAQLSQSAQQGRPGFSFRSSQISCILCQLPKRRLPIPNFQNPPAPPIGNHDLRYQTTLDPPTHPLR